MRARWRIRPSWPRAKRSLRSSAVRLFRKNDSDGSESKGSQGVPSPIDSEGRLRLQCWYCGNTIAHEGSTHAR